MPLVLDSTGHTPLTPQQQQDRKWRSESIRNIDSATLDWDTFSKGKDIQLDFDATPEIARKKLIVDSYLDTFNDGEPYSPVSIQRDTLRDRIADTHFEGRGRGSDDDFYTQIETSAYQRKDSAELNATLRSDSLASQIRHVAGATPSTFNEWHKLAKNSPGYNSDKVGEYLQTWSRAQNQASEKLIPIAPHLEKIWSAFKSKQNTYILAHETYQKLDADQRQHLLAGISLLAHRLPEEEQATFWGNFGKQSLRDAEGLAQAAGDYLLNHIADGIENSAVYDKEHGKELAGGIRDQVNFAHDIERIQHSQFDPIKLLAGESDDFWDLATIERGVYAAPGALMTSVQAAIPGIGLGLTYATIESQSYKQVRHSLMDQGLSDADATRHASNWKGVIAVPSAALEKLGAGALVGRFPGAEKALTSLSNKLTNKAARYGARAAVGATYETSIEVAQEFIPSIVQEVAAGLDKDVPDVEWHNGKDGALDGFWSQTGSTFVAVLPLALIGAAGGFSKEARARAWADANPTALRAMGITEQDTLNITAAAKQGPESLNKAVETAQKNADPQSQAAKDATHELAEELQAEKERVEKFQKSGTLPRFQRTSSGWEVFDGQTDELVGTAPNASAAFRLGNQHSAAMEDANAETIAYLASTLQTIDETQNTRDTPNQSDNDGKQTPRETTTDFRPGQSLTTTQAAALSEENAERIHQQTAARETLEQGSSDITNFVLGQSTTEFKQKTRHTTNKLQAGASVLTVFHEETHGFFREALETNRLTKSDTISYLRAVEKTLAGKTSKEGSSLSLLPENDADITDTLLDEAVSELMEAEILRTRGQDGARLTPGVISRNLTAIAKHAPEAAAKFTSFIRAIRAYFGLALSRAHAIKKAIRDGNLDEKQLEEFKTKLFGLNQQDEHDQATFHAAKDLVPDSLEEADPFSIRRNAAATLESRKGETITPIEIPTKLPSVKEKNVFQYLLKGDNSITGKHPNDELDIEFEIDRYTLSKSVKQSQKTGEPEGSHLIRIAASHELPAIIKSAVAIEVEDTLSERGAQKIYDLFNAITWKGKTYRVRVKAVIEVKRNHARSLRIDDIVVKEMAPSEEEANGAQAPPSDVLRSIPINQLFNHVNPFDGSSFSTGSYPLINPAQDAEYMAAVESGDVETQQAMVDDAAKAAGYDSPKVYHGTNGKSFVIFSKRKRGSATDNGMLGKAFYFGSKRTAERYGNTVIPAYLSLKNPLEIDLYKNKEDLAKYLNIESNILTIGGTGIKSLQPYTSVFSEAVKDKGHDGVITKFETAVFEPNQIKSAEPVTNDTEGNVIPLSQRFNETKDSISYSITNSPLSERIARAASTPPLDLTIDTTSDKDSLRKSALKKITSTLQKGIKNTHSNKIVTANNKSLKHTKNHTGSHERIAILDNIEHIIKDATWLIAENPDDRKPNEQRQGFTYHNLAHPITVNGEPQLAWITVKKDSTGRNLYNIEELEVLKNKKSPLKEEIELNKPTSLSSGDIKKIIHNKLKVKEHLHNPGASFSMVPAHMVEALLTQLNKLPTNPKQKAEYFGNVSKNLAKLRRDTDLHIAAFGNVGTIEAIEAPRPVASLRKEAAMRQALRTEELTDQAHAAAHGLGHMDEAITKLRSQPIHEFLADPSNSLRGVLISITAAKHRPDFHQETLSQYDGSGDTSRTLFGGYLMPDQAAQELHTAGLINQPTTDAMWQALSKEAQSVKQLSETLKTLKENLTAAKKQAREEADAWLKKKIAKQKKDHNPRSQVLRSLAMLDGILATLPAKVRGKIGGHTALARLNSDRARLNYLVKKTGQIEAEFERYLRGEYDTMLQKLIDRARPQKDKPGEKKTGKITYTVHELFQTIDQSRHLTLDHAEAEVLKIESLIAKGTLSPTEEAHKELEALLLPLVAEWGKADAARRAQAYEMARSIFEVGYYNHKLKKAKQAEARDRQRQSLRASTGSRGTAAQRKKKAIEANGFKGKAINGFLSLLSFEQVTRLVFGENSTAATTLIQGELAASNSKEDANQERMQEIEDFFTAQSGTLLAGERLRYDMAQPSIDITVAHTGETMKLSQFEAVAATLMWRQEDGKRHMIGHLDENNKPAGEWHYNQDFIDQIEKALDPHALSWRNFVANAYAEEHGRINPVYRELYSVSLPSSSNYSPLTVQPVQTTGAQGTDPVTGQATNGASITPGSLKSRSSSAVAEPDFQDSLQTYIAHTKQIEHWIAYAPLTTEARAIMNHRTVSNAIEGAAGKEALTVLRSWLDLFTEGGTRDASAHLALNKGLGRAISRAASSALIGRMSVLIIQSTQLGAAMAQMPMTSYIKRFSKLMTGQLQWGTALKSDYIQRRIKQMPIVVQQAMQGLEGRKPNAIKHAASRIGNLIGGADGLFTAGTYAMIYDYQLTEAVNSGLSPAEAEIHAHKMAEQLTDQVAQPTRAGARSLYENSATNPLFKLLWAFSSEPRQKLALLAYNTAKKPTPQKLRTIALVLGVNGLAAQLIRTSWRDLRDDDDDEIFDEKHWSLGRILTASATSPLDGIPVVGDMTESAINGALGYWQPDGHLLDGGTRAIRGIQHTDDIIAGDRDAGEILKDIDGLLTGLAMTNETIAAASSFSHIVRDLFDIGKNLAD